MARGVHPPAHFRDAAGHARRCFVVHDGDGLDGAAAAVLEPGLDDLRIHAVPPVAGHEIHVEAEPRGHVAPQRGEMAGLEHQHGVAGRQRVHERRFPRPGAR